MKLATEQQAYLDLLDEAVIFINRELLEQKFLESTKSCFTLGNASNYLLAHIEKQHECMVTLLEEVSRLQGILVLAIAASEGKNG